ncbi:MAG: YdcF family protein [Hyphomicrobiales bacterium]|nr:YdcF family protein [Hyphomicrobiales bacterium]
MDDRRDHDARRRARGVLVLAAKLAGALAGAFVVGFLVFTGVVERAAERQASALRPADGIVALTGGESRVSVAVGLLSRAYGKRLLISGVHPSTSRFHLIRLNPQNAALFRCCIDLDKNALDTAGNAYETAAWARRRGFRSLIVVTSIYHMPRSLMELRRVLPDAVLIPYPVRSPNFDTERWWSHPPSLRLMLAEYLKLFPSLARYAADRVFPDDAGASAHAKP